jgi:hypothetical protein
MGVTAGAGEELMRLGSRPWPDMLAPCVAVPVSPLMSARSSSSRRSRRTGAPEHIASSLERSADRPAPRGPLRCQGQQPRPRRDALGLVPFWAKDIKVGFGNINAKAEVIESKPAFREAFQPRRCLVPVDNFYEWKKTATGKQPQ